MVKKKNVLVACTTIILVLVLQQVKADIFFDPGNLILTGSPSYNITVNGTCANETEANHCLLYGTYINGSACFLTQISSEDDQMMIGISIIMATLFGFLIAMSVVIDPNNFWMRVLKLFFLMCAFYLTIPLLGLALGFAKDAGAASYITDTLNSVYAVDTWVIRVFTGFIMLYLTWEALTALAQHKKAKRQELEESV